MRNHRALLLAYLLSTCAFFHYLKSLSISSSVNKLSKYVSTHRLVYATCTDNSIVPNNWCIDNKQTPRYVGKLERPPPMIQHYTNDGYDECLAGKTVVFIGDSRVRYQFMHLAALLTFKRFMKCSDHINQSTPEDICYFISEKDSHMPFNLWYRKTATALDSVGEGYQQSNLCDCYRPAFFKPMLTYENRFIKRTTRFGTTNLVYLQNFLNVIRLNQQYPPYTPFYSTTKRCKPGECGYSNRTDTFEGDLNATLWEVLPKLNTTHAFINLGWEQSAGFQNQSDFSCVMQDFERHFPDIKLFLISHPPAVTDSDHPERNFNVTKLKCDVNVLDRTTGIRMFPRHGTMMNSMS